MNAYQLTLSGHYLLRSETNSADSFCVLTPYSAVSIQQIQQMYSAFNQHPQWNNI